MTKHLAYVEIDFESAHRGGSTRVANNGTQICVLDPDDGHEHPLGGRITVSDE